MGYNHPIVEKEDNKVDTFGAVRLNLLSDDVEEITSSNNELTETTGRAIPAEYARLSYAGRINYAFDNKYLFEATMRADASSIVAPEARWGYFPSVSMGWNIAEENFLKDVNFINDISCSKSHLLTKSAAKTNDPFNTARKIGFLPLNF